MLNGFMPNRLIIDYGGGRRSEGFFVVPYKVTGWTEAPFMTKGMTCRCAQLEKIKYS